MSIDPADMYEEDFNSEEEFRLNAFEEFWDEIKEYAKEVGATPQYIEEEFVIEGELVRVDPVYLTPISRDC